MTRVLPITVGLTLLLAAPASADELIDTLTVPYSAVDPVESSVSLKAGTDYTLVVSGTGAQTSDGSTVECDALYCLSSQTGQPFSRKVLTFASDGTGEIGSLDDVANKEFPYDPGHTYSGPIDPQFGQVSGKLRVDSHGPGAQCGQGGLTCSGNFTVQIYGPGAATGGFKCPQGTRAARVAKLNGIATFRQPSGSFVDLHEGDEICLKSEVASGPDSELVLEFADTGTVRVSELTQFRIDEFVDQSTRIKVEMLLLNGELISKVKPTRAVSTDYSVTTPEATAGVKGTVFTVTRDAIAKRTTVVTQAGAVEVDPKGKGATTMVVGGKAVDVMPSGIRAVPRKTAAARAKARARVLDRIARARACKLTVKSVTVAASGKAWKVTVKTSRGKSVWKAGAKVSPRNKIARTIAGNCS